MKINYVIASYEGKNKRKHKHPSIDKVLCVHLQKLLSLGNDLDQVTIMRPECNKNKVENYYENAKELIKEFKIPVKIIECENFGYSNGQWLTAYETYKDEYDYYIFIEDDYCPNIHNFDKILTELYIEKFPEKIGLLCSLVQGSKNYRNKGGYPIHWEGVVVLNKNTLEKLYSCEKWKGNPRKYLDLIDHTIDDGYNWEKQRRSYIGAYYQLTMSHLFTLSEIEHEDYLGEKKKWFSTNSGNYHFPYWSDSGGVFFYDKGDIIRKKYDIEDIINSIIIPVQLASVEYIYNNTSLEIIKEKFPERNCLDIVEYFKEYIKDKTFCDLGCGGGDLLEYIRINKYAKKIIGVEKTNRGKKKWFSTNNRTYIINDDFLSINLPEADVYFMWLGEWFPYKKIFDKMENNKIIILADSRRENHIKFERNIGIELLKIVSYKYDETKYVKNMKKYEEYLNKMQRINLNFTILGERLFGIYKFNKK